MTSQPGLPEEDRFITPPHGHPEDDHGMPAMKMQVHEPPSAT